MIELQMQGGPLPNSACAWQDVEELREGMVSEQRLHQLIRQPGYIADRTFEIEELDPGVEAYAFTFGCSAANWLFLAPLCVGVSRRRD
jgi:Thioredoxin like C-terminal domain